jgi:ferric-dicitrate binding protein FerR (iron transport regulator)
MLLGVSTFAWTQQSVIEYVEGQVTVSGQSGDFEADFGTPLVVGDTVITGPAGIAILRINSRTQVKLRENTRLTVESATEQAAVRLERGGVFARVARETSNAARTLSGFEVRTPSVVAGVRGTEFFVAYGRTIEDEPDLWLCVNEGTVAVAVTRTGQETVVEEGEGINILAGLRATDPRPYAWTKQLNWGFDPAEGEVRDDTDLDGAYADLLDQDYD